ncbi:hypothetical protein ACGIF2_03245 [Cellulomonas sp. P22]|uniref:hypothetical protein n=1 Tax=Cellulomonas sp. P22 TaxID=3373189 RepID=UPI00378D4AB3
MKQLFFSGPDWPGPRRQQVAQARQWFIEWRTALPERRTWLAEELAARGGPPVTRRVEGLDSIVEWIEQLSGPYGAPPADTDIASLPTAPEWGSGNAWWDAAAAGLTALVAEVMQRERPRLELALFEQRGDADDLRPTWAGRPGVPGPATLVGGSLGMFRLRGARRLETALQTNLQQIDPGTSSPSSEDDCVTVQVYLEVDPAGDDPREVLVNVDEWAQEALGDAVFVRLENVFASVDGIESIEQTDRDEFEAVLTAAGALELEAVRDRLQAALDALT